MWEQGMNAGRRQIVRAWFRIDRERCRYQLRALPAVLLRFVGCLFIVLLLGVTVCFPLSGRAAGREPFRVLVLHSYHHGFIWTDTLQKGIEETFKNAAVDTELSVEYLDSKRHPGPLLFDSLQKVYADKYARWPPDLIISCDDDALVFLFQYRNALFPGVPVVFCGLNVDDYDPAILQGRVGYTGVVERLDLAGTLELILQMQPDVHQVAFIHDQTTSGLADRETIAALAPGYTDRLKFMYPDGGTDDGVGVSEEELLVFLEELPSNSAVYFLGFFRDRFDTPLALNYIIPRISEVSPVPVYSHAEAFLGYGILGGKLLSAEVHGRSTAEKALRLLAGIPVEQTPVSVESSNRYMFDYRQLKRFDIAESSLPEDSRVLFQPSSFWERYRSAIVWGAIGLAVLLAFTGALLVNTMRRHRIERRLAASEKQYRLLADHATDMISRHDAAGVYLYASPACRLLLGYEPEELIGRNAYEFYHAEDLVTIRTNHDTIFKQPTLTTVSYRLRHKHGHYIWVESTCKSIGNAQMESIDEIIAVTRDITERKKVQEERLRMEKHLLTVQRLESLGSLTGGIAHDFNNILMAMLGNIELVKDRVSADPKSLQRLERSMQGGQRAAAIIRQMLVFSGNENFVFQPVDLNRLIESIFELLQTAVHKRGSLDLQLERPLAQIEADETQIRQLLMNLIVNAAESYGEDGGGAVTLSTGIADCDPDYLADTEPDVWLAYHQPFPAGRFVFLEVEDTGAGMEPEKQRRLFEPFFTTKFQGRGLGLSAVLGIVRGHNGFIRVDSEAGQGTVIRVLFPALADAEGTKKPSFQP